MVTRPCALCGPHLALVAHATAPCVCPIAGGMGASKKTVEALKALPPQQQLMMATLGKLLGEVLLTLVACAAA